MFFGLLGNNLEMMNVVDLSTLPAFHFESVCNVTVLIIVAGSHPKCENALDPVG